MPKNRTIAPKYRMCRAWQHAWDYTTVHRDHGEYVQGLACMRCGAKRSVRISARSGERLKGGSYDYSDAPGYVLTGGRLTPKERSEILLTEITGNLPRSQRGKVDG